MNARSDALIAALGKAHTPTPPPGHAGGVSWHALRSMRVLQGLSEERLAQLAAQCHWRTLEPRQVLHDAYADRRLHFVVQGQMWISIQDQHGREMALGEIMQGACFGECRSVPEGDNPTPVLVQATQPTLIASLSPHDTDALFDSEPMVVRAIATHLSDLIRRLAKRVLELGTMGARGRLYTRLLVLAEREHMMDNQVLLQPSPRQTDLAALLGSSREEVAREMSRLTRMGLLQREGRNLRLCNVDGLRLLLEDAH